MRQRLINSFIISLILFFTQFHLQAQSTEILPGGLLPQMTTTQRTTLANPAKGLLVFDTQTNSYWFYQSNAWVELPKGGSSSNYWEINGLAGNELKNTNSGGFWSENVAGISKYADDITNPQTSPVNGNGTRLMWIPLRSAFRVGTVYDHTGAWDADRIGLFSFASGYNTEASGKFSIAMGENSKAQGLNSLAIGAYSYATANSSIAIGEVNGSSGEYSVSIGSYNIASGSASMALGFRTKAKASAGTSIGIYNDDQDTPGDLAEETDRIFQIGNGSYVNRSNAFTVLRNAKTGINTAFPLAGLHVWNVSGSNPDWDRHIRLQFDADDYGNIVYDEQGMKFRNWGTGDDFYFRDDQNTTLLLIQDTGNATLAGSLTQNSDRRLKKDIVPLDGSLKKIAAIKGYHYYWKEENRSASLQTGLIAQEIQELFPELVEEDQGGSLSVNYIGLIPHLIESIKELKSRNELLIQDKNAINAKLNAIEAQIDQLIEANSSTR